MCSYWPNEIDANTKTTQYKTKTKPSIPFVLLFCLQSRYFDYDDDEDYDDSDEDDDDDDDDFITVFWMWIQIQLYSQISNLSTIPFAKQQQNVEDDDNKKKRKMNMF